MDLKQLMQVYQQQVDTALATFLPAANLQPTRLHEAMRYSVLNGGKRVRPLLVYLTGQALGIETKRLDIPACSVELVHAYSLVHDDLPAMDDDDLRRGKPTCHKAYDEATAILAGDALQTLAFQILAHQAPQHFSSLQCIKMLEALSVATGSRGMAGGQAIDIDSVGRQLNIAELENMHIHKTGALIRASVQLGALGSEGIDEAQLEKLDHYAKCIGLAFQVQDDILDIESSTEVLGKSQGSDIANNKPTYPALLGLQGAKELAQDLLDQALNSLADFDEKADPLRWMARYIVTRAY